MPRRDKRLRDALSAGTLSAGTVAAGRLLTVVLGVTVVAAIAHADGESWQHHSRHVVPTVPRPTQATLALRSPRTPLSIHVVGGPLAADLPARAMAAAEHTLAAMAGLGVPAPPSDGGRGGSLDLDVYLDPAARGGAAYTEPEPALRFDQLPSYVVVGADPVHACGFEHAVSRGLVQAAMLGLDAAAHEGTLGMLGSYLASLISPCPSVEIAAVDAFQRAPERSLSAGDRRSAQGSLLFPAFLDARYGTGGVGAVMLGLVAVSAQATPSEASRFVNEPDIYDALRKVLPSRGAQLGDLMIDFAVARAFVGDRADGLHIPDSERFGAMGRVRFEWAIDHASLPRQLAPKHDVEAMGASYLWLDLAGADPHLSLQLVAQWESSQVFQWAVVRIDGQGRELGRAIIGGVFGNDRAELSISDVDGAAALMIVGVHLGSDDRSAPFDPDIGAPREASYTVTLHRT